MGTIEQSPRIHTRPGRAGDEAPPASTATTPTTHTQGNEESPS